MLYTEVPALELLALLMELGGWCAGTGGSRSGCNTEVNDKNALDILVSNFNIILLRNLLFVIW
jgi:hypothetical protein